MTVREHHPLGFTLLELMIAITVIGVLLTVGVPGFFEVIRSNRAAANANELVSALSIARSEAIRRGARVSMCRGSDCTGAWADGWIVFTDSATNDDANPGVGEVLRVWPALSGTPAVTTAADWVRFLPRGDVRTNAVFPITFRIEPADCSGEQARIITLNAAGRTIVERVAC